MKASLFFKKGDLLIYGMLLTLLLAFSLLLFRRDGSCAVVTTPDGVQSISLLKESTTVLHSGGYTMTLVVADGGIRCTECTCPDKICVATGCIAKSGEAIICLPARISVVISDGEEPYDAVAE